MMDGTQSWGQGSWVSGNRGYLCWSPLCALLFFCSFFLLFCAFCVFFAEFMLDDVVCKQEKQKALFLFFFFPHSTKRFVLRVRNCLESMDIVEL